MYDDKYAFSHHATDPAGGKLCNAFDLVRWHLFTPGGTAPDGAHVGDGKDSVRRMQEYAAQDEATRQRYLQTIYAKEADMETLVNRLFDVFYRGDAARTTPGNGSGIGLAVVKRSAQEMGGTVRAENEAGGGLRVVVTLPLPLIDKCCPYQSTVAKEDRHGENTYH